MGQGWQGNKTRFEKNRFLLPGFFGFFQTKFEKTRVFSGFFKIFSFLPEKSIKMIKKCSFFVHSFKISSKMCELLKCIYTICIIFYSELMTSALYIDY